jgi:hypothetical protein
MPVNAMIGGVEQAAGDRMTQVVRPAAPEESWRRTIGEDGGRRTAFLGRPMEKCLAPRRRVG